VQAPGLPGRRRRVCLVFLTAHYWLRQPTHLVRAHLASELGVDVPAPRDAADSEATDVIPRIESDPSDKRAESSQTPAVPLTPTLPPGRPDIDHGRAGDDPVAVASLLRE
jgi:hypothetical protein